MKHDLPQRASKHEQLVRRQSVAEGREQYRWRHIPGLPPHCDGVPKAETRPAWRTENMMWDVAGSFANSMESMVKRFRKKRTHLRYFDAYYSLRPKPVLFEGGRWRTDQEFGRQRMDGVNPHALRLVTELPENFPATDADLPQSVGHHTLQSLMADHRLYLVDYQPLDGVPVRSGRYCSAPIALFWMDDLYRLMPLVVQLTQEPATPKLLFTPDDDEWLWQRVKADLQAADAAYHEVVAHLFRTHLVMETVWVAACRALPTQHPIHELLSNHFTGTIAINDSARTVMLAPGGPIDEAISIGHVGAMWLIGNEYDEWTFENAHPLVDLENRGVNDPQALPGYHYRDDARRHWATIDRYTRDLLRLYYTSDDDVLEDFELQAWAWELAHKTGGSIRGLPLDSKLRFTSFEDLQRTIAQIVFCCSAEHAAVNNGQWDIFGYIPNAPGAMWTPPPQEKRPSSEAEFCAAMPLPHAIAEQLMLAHLLSAPTTMPIGSADRDWFHDNHDVRYILDRFATERDRITEDIAFRNQLLNVPYGYLDPRRVGRSIAV